MDLNIVLIEPEIPQNTGAIGRLCVCLGARLHLIKPLGFSLDVTSLKRAGLDYWQFLTYYTYNNWNDFWDVTRPSCMIFLSTKGGTPYYEFQFHHGDYLVFGNESRGLPNSFYQIYQKDLFVIPMPGKHSRSLNLANAAAIVSYEAYRQIYHCPHKF